MILKDAYRYQNFLTALLNQIKTWLGRSSFTTTTRETHYRHAANPDADDETVVQVSDSAPGFTVSQLLDFLVLVLKERQKLSDAISAAKRTTPFDMDSAVTVNHEKQSVVACLKTMLKVKNGETKTTGSGYKFDVTGEQKRYVYDILLTATVNFDRDNIRKLIKKYSKECDAVSAELDKLMITTEVDYTAPWDLDDTLEDIMESLFPGDTAE